MKPFNLQKAIDGKPIVTRDGKKVLDFHYFKNCVQYRQCVVVIEGNSGSLSEYDCNGRFLRNEESNFDLFMYEAPKTYYVNVYKSKHENIGLGGMYNSKEEALELSHKDGTYIKTIEITIP